MQQLLQQGQGEWTCATGVACCWIDPVPSIFISWPGLFESDYKRYWIKTTWGTGV